MVKKYGKNDRYMVILYGLFGRNKVYYEFLHAYFLIKSRFTNVFCGKNHEISMNIIKTSCHGQKIRQICTQHGWFIRIFST